MKDILNSWTSRYHVILSFQWKVTWSSLKRKQAECQVLGWSILAKHRNNPITHEYLQCHLATLPNPRYGRGLFWRVNFCASSVSSYTSCFRVDAGLNWGLLLYQITYCEYSDRNTHIYRSASHAGNWKLDTFYWSWTGIWRFEKQVRTAEG